MPATDHTQILDKITAFADQSHGRQMRKYTPERYIVHPVRVMKLCAEYTSDLPMLAAALLHDVVEDTPVTLKDISAFTSGLMSAEDAARTTKLVEELTDVYTVQAYPNWNREQRKHRELQRMVLTSPDAQTIKYADIIDNASEIVTADPEFAVVFINECHTLLNSMNKGNATLYARAQKAINNCLQQLAAQ